MKQLFLFALAGTLLFGASSCTKDANGTDSFENISTPRSNPVPEEMVGRWAIVSISGSTVYNIPSGSTHNTNESFLGYQINKDGTTREDGYIATYQYGVSTWVKWSAVGTVEISGNSISFHRERGKYTSSRNSSETIFGSAEVYPNKTSRYNSFRIGTDGRGNKALIVTNSEGSTTTYVKQ